MYCNMLVTVITVDHVVNTCIGDYTVFSCSESGQKLKPSCAMPTNFSDEFNKLGTSSGSLSDYSGL